MDHSNSSRSVEDPMIAQDKTNNSNLEQPGKVRQWIFRIIGLIIIPIILLGSLELGLRLFGFGYPANAIIKSKIDGREIYSHNLKFGWRFFAKVISRKFYGFVFDADKQPQTYRIFILGASAAAGKPVPAYSFGRILEVMLGDMYPHTRFEVITAAMPALNSHVVREIAKECAKYEPDLFVVYLGNNEVVGPFGPKTAFVPLSRSLLAIRANIKLKATKSGQLLDRMVTTITSLRKTPKQRLGLEMFLGKQIRPNDPAMQYVYSHYEQNLTDICKEARKAGAKIILSNVGGNLRDSAPLASLHKTNLTDAEKQEWEDIYNRGIELERNRRYQEAIESYLDAAEIDSTFADLQFRLGRCFWSIREYKKAKQHYIDAHQFDTLRFRADARMNEIIQSIARDKAEKGIYFVDTISVLEQNSPHQTPGQEFFYDHVHFNFKGNFMLARTIFSQIQTILSESIRPEKESILREEQCAQHLAYTGFDEHFVLNVLLETIDHPPFTNQLYYDDLIRNLKGKIETLEVYTKPPKANSVLSEYHKAIDLHPHDWVLLWRYAAFLQYGLNDPWAAEEQLRQVIEICPADFAYMELGRNLHRQGRHYESKTILQTLLEMNPTAALYLRQIGLLPASKRSWITSNIMTIVTAISILCVFLMLFHLVRFKKRKTES
jgi:tetratricopeptide (TPR) repeat protein